jgi:hypothetical protein
MRILRCLVLIALALGINSKAKADTLDFHMVVLDPFATNPIFITPFSFTFVACSAGQLPTNVMNSYQGCYSGVNRTGQDWTGLQMVFANTSALGSQPAGCALDGSTDFFATASCTLAPDSSTYILSFTTGIIPNNGSFVIAEDGVSPDAFPMITASVTTSGGTTVTPEPGSIWLMCTGVLMTGFYLTKRHGLV